MVKTNKKILSKRARKNIFILGMLLIPIIHFIIFWVAVNFNSFLLAFQKMDAKTGQNYFTADHFLALKINFTNSTLKDALINTLLTFGFNTLFLLPWGFLLTYFLYKKIRLSGFWRTMLFVPSILPAIAMTSIFIRLINSAGPIGALWELFHESPLQLLAERKTARWTILLFIFWTNFGGQFILFSGAMSRVPKEVIESARLDGAGMWREMLKIVLPLCWPTISVLLLLNLASIFTATGPILLLTKGEAGTKTLSYWIFDLTRMNVLGEPAALGLVCTLLLFPIILVSRWGLNKVYANVEF